MQGMRRYAAYLLSGAGLLSAMATSPAQRPQPTPSGVPPNLPVIATSVPVRNQPPPSQETALVPAPRVPENPLVRVSVASPAVERALPTAPSAGPPPLFLEKLGPTSLEAGRPASYDLVVRNTGSQSVQHVRVDDELPPGVTFLESEPAANASDGHLAWEFANLEPRAERRIRISIRAAQAGELRATATATFTAAATLLATVNPNPLAVRVYGPERVLVGEGVHFEVTIRNAGTTPFRRVVLRDQLPSGLRHPRGPLVESEVGALDPGEVRIIPLDALALASGAMDTEITILADTGPTATQRATVLVREPEKRLVPPVEMPPVPAPVKQTPRVPDPVPSATPNLLPASFTSAPTLRLDVVGPTTALRAGAEVEYYVRLVNPGNVKVSNIELEVDLTSGLEALGAEGPQRHSLRAQRVLFDPLPELAPHTEMPYRLRVRATRPGTFRLIIAAGCDQAVESVSRELAVRVVPPSDAASAAGHAAPASYAGTYEEINKR